MGAKCHVILTYTTYIGECIIVVKLNWEEHGWGTCGYTLVQQGKTKEFYNIIGSTTKSQPNRPHLKRVGGPNKN